VRQRFSADEGAAGERLDVFLAASLEVTRAQAQKLIKDGRVQVEGTEERAGYKIQSSNSIEVALPEALSMPIEAPELPILYEDDDLLVVDKPAGLTVHSGSGTAGQATAADFARSHTTDDDAERPGIVHRLDRDTSGLLIIAKTPDAKAYLQQQFQAHHVKKTYLLLVIGRLKPDEAVIRLPLSRHPLSGLRQTVTASGREAITRYRTLATYPGYSLVEATPETGRTHQLRVHFAALGHPIVGDTKYGPKIRPLGLARQFLHAASLNFTGPSGRSVSVASKLPRNLENVLHDLSKKV
jgi:23S rRNA pseudouridine1911/1915/1917 synthase